ncbi:uncharacterized protein BYT42DRAFT_545624 [Radiomyces spectabilis]|uniref:uncharacterized protein n=1 Tax=Radiomyces spectabilis TaxID=64574 RepID=UPI00222060CB|nr:uncharacterized protein BYT42DRAFT_545624 [Radiomyces spectabilis]KAI8379231.1 hypothetical protein BYT42DRAFT_545624 [Radiomyces spectabilis]
MLSTLVRTSRAVVHGRLYTTATVTEAAKETKRLVYTTPNAALVRFLKLFSVSTLGISSLSAPAVMYFWDSPAIQASGINEYMFLGALVASTCSTGALHYVLSPFVNNIYLHTSSSPSAKKEMNAISPNTVITLETLDIAARRKQTTLPLRNLAPAPGIFSTWKVPKKVLQKQLAQEQRTGASSPIRQTRFWLDQRGLGDQQAMSNIVRVIQDNDRRRRLV